MARGIEAEEFLEARPYSIHSWEEIEGMAQDWRCWRDVVGDYVLSK